MARKLIKRLLATLGVVGLSAGSAGAQENADLQCDPASSIQIEVECACERALEEDTIEALEDFIREYGEYDSASSFAAK